jgi:hypothetical protein
MTPPPNDAEQQLLGPYQTFAVEDWSDQPEELGGLYSAIAYVRITLPTVLRVERHGVTDRIRTAVHAKAVDVWEGAGPDRMIAVDDLDLILDEAER